MARPLAPTSSTSSDRICGPSTTIRKGLQPRDRLPAATGRHEGNQCSTAQSSCPYESARQKIFGLGYSLLVFAYEKHDDDTNNTGRLDIQHLVFVEASRTADFQTTTGIADILRRDGNKDDLVAFMADRMLPVDDIEAANIADEIVESPPDIGYLTISNALQWRLQYRRVIDQANAVAGISRLR